MQELKSENNIFLGIALILVVLGFFITLGVAGLRTALGFIILVFAPFYIIFSNFSLSNSEKAVFSFFAAITLFPSLVYWLGFVISFRLSIFIVSALLLLAAFAVKKLAKR